jgi:DNA repair protein RecO (recombination protein O)
MNLIETEGLVLKSYSLAEADKIVVFLTRDNGLIRGVAKGARRLKSRFGGSLEPFSVVRLTYFQKEEKELVSIKNCEIIKSFFGKAGHPEILRKFSYITELLNGFAPPSDPNERLYRMARVWLEAAGDRPENLDQMIFYFELWLLKLGGYLPSWEKCNVCKKVLEGGSSFTLQANFELVCCNCKSTRNAQRSAPLNFLDLTGNKANDWREVSVILKQMIAGILGTERADERILMAKGF